MSYLNAAPNLCQVASGDNSVCIYGRGHDSSWTSYSLYVILLNPYSTDGDIY